VTGTRWERSTEGRSHIHLDDRICNFTEAFKLIVAIYREKVRFCTDSCREWFWLI